MAVRVNLRVNGQDVGLNPFVQEALAGVVTGFIGALERVPEPATRIEIVVENAGDKSFAGGK